MPLRASLRPAARALRRFAAGVKILVFCAGGSLSAAPHFSVEWTVPDEVRVPLRLHRGVPQAACRINGRAVWMIVDTGSQATVLEADTAARCGVLLLERAGGKITLAGLGGTEPARAGLPAEMSLGGWRWRRLPCLVRTRQTRAPGLVLFPARLRFDLLGMDALRAMCSSLTLDFPRRELILRFRQKSSADPTGEPLEFGDGLPYVRIRGAACLVDTGSAGGPEIGLGTGAAGPGAGPRLGCAAWANARVTLDFQRARLRVEKN